MSRIDEDSDRGEQREASVVVYVNQNTHMDIHLFTHTILYPMSLRATDTDSSFHSVVVPPPSFHSTSSFQAKYLVEGPIRN